MAGWGWPWSRHAGYGRIQSNSDASSSRHNRHSHASHAPFKLKPTGNQGRWYTYRCHPGQHISMLYTLQGEKYNFDLEYIVVDLHDFRWPIWKTANVWHFHLNRVLPLPKFPAAVFLQTIVVDDEDVIADSDANSEIFPVRNGLETRPVVNKHLLKLHGVCITEFGCHLELVADGPEWYRDHGFIYK